MDDLAARTLVMVVGPSAVGKSTLMNEVVRLDPTFGRVRSFTTRPPRSNDEPGQYLYLSERDIAARAAKDEIVTDVIYPTTGFRYGTVIESYSHTYNLLDTLAHTVDQYRELPFARTVTISLTTDPLAWKAWLAGRFPDGGEDMRRRLEEAESSIRWSLAQADDHHWLVNRPDSIGDTARALITMVKHTQLAAPVPPEAEELLSCAKNLLSYDIEKREHHG